MDNRDNLVRRLAVQGKTPFLVCVASQICSNGHGMTEQERLAGWKRISVYLGRSLKTAQRWKAERGLPVYQDKVTGRVHAYRGEIDDWLKRQHGLEGPDEEDSRPSRGDGGAPRGRRFYWLIACAALVAAAAIGLLFRVPHPKPVPLREEKITAGRLLWRATAEHRAIDTVAIPKYPYLLALTTDDTRVVGADHLATSVWVFDLRTKAVQWVNPGTTVLSLAMAPDGAAFYVGSGQDGLVKVELPGLTVGPLIPTGGAINDIAVTPDSKQLILAMMHKGVKRFDTASNVVSAFRRDPCPYFVDISPAGTMVAVSDQCGGVEGREGHDTVEVMDLKSGKSLHYFKGPPMVGGDLKFSPDEEFLWLDAWDACRTPRYDHQGCPAVPAWIWQVFRLPANRLAKTVPLPAHSGRPPVFLNRRTVATLGQSIAVYDAINFNLREETRDRWAGSTTISWDGRTVFAALANSGPPDRLLKFEREPEQCAVPETDLVHFLPLDGAAGDWVENASISPPDKLKYVAGLVGQAIELDGGEQLFVHSSTESRSFAVSSTLMLSVRPRADGPMPLIEYPRAPAGPAWAVWLDEAQRPVWQVEMGNTVRFRSVAEKSLVRGEWNHLAFVRDGDRFLTYVNGERAGSVHAADVSLVASNRPMPFGHSARLQGRFAGTVDELALWSRPLTAAEVKAEAAKRTAGPCKP